MSWFYRQSAYVLLHEITAKGFMFHVYQLSKLQTFNHNKNSTILLCVLLNPPKNKATLEITIISIIHTENV